jgi:hypothetical protein
MPRRKQPEALSLDELNSRIAQAKWGFDNADNATMRKLRFKGLCEIEAERERLHSIPAPDRSLSSPPAMTDTHVVSALKTKRSQVAGQIESLEGQLLS